MDLTGILQIIGIISFFAGTIKFIIVDPIQSALKAMNEALKKLEDLIGGIDKEQKILDRRLLLAEESLKALHKRLDAVYTFLERRKEEAD